MEQEEEIEEKKGKGNISVSVTDPKTKYVSTYSMSTRIKKNLDTKIIPDLNKRDKDAFIIIDGSEGCFFKDTLIKTSDGDKRIEDLYNHKPFFVESLNLETNKIEQGKAICVKTGTQELFEIETEDGRKVKATKNHTFFVLREGKVYEVKLSDLKEGDELICR